MIPADPANGTVIDWGWAGRALENLSGDLHIVVPFPGGALVALIDGLGHGQEAFAAAAAAAAVLQTHGGEPVVALVERCHDALRKTRGAALSLASFDSHNSSMSWTGVGNVDAILLSAKSTPPRRRMASLAPGSGIVGFRLPPLRSEAHPVSPGDILIMTTDGVRSGFQERVAAGSPPQEMAAGILAEFAKGSDDARVVAVRYRGTTP
jgi:phosphoserine phosphatase RsbX